VTRYLSVEQIVAINADQEGFIGVADLPGIEAAAHRPQSEYFGHEVFPDLWSKAAAYVHGFATTQYFTDAKKRTAWLVATTFIALNNARLRRVAPIEAETFVQAVAQDVYRTEEDPERTLERAAEWFRANRQFQNRVHDPRIDWIFVAASASTCDEDGSLDIRRGGLDELVVRAPHGQAFPKEIPFSVVGRVLWPPKSRVDDGRIAAVIVPGGLGTPEHRKPIINPVGRPIRQTDDVQRLFRGGGIGLFHVDMRPVFAEPGPCRVALVLGEDVAATLPLSVRHSAKQQISGD
jgi:death-on-curing protein